MRIVLANVSADDNRGGAAITAATLLALGRAFPGAEVSLLPALAIRDLRCAFRHTRQEFRDVEWLPPLAETLPGTRIAWSLVRGSDRPER